jgi:hypothetical protein
MNESDKKLITEKLLGGCWHEVGIGPVGVFLCKKCGYVPDEITDNFNRTFTTPKDFMDCFDKLVELGKWEEFDIYCWSRFFRERVPQKMDILYSQWLNSRTKSGHMRLCVLCAEWLKEDTHEQG